MLLLFFPFAACRQWLCCYAPSFAAKPNSVCVTSPLPQMTTNVQTSLKSARNSKAELGFLKGSWKGGRLGGDLRRELRVKPGATFLPWSPGSRAITRWQWSYAKYPGACHPRCLFTLARMCARPGAGGVVGKAELCSRNPAAAGRAGPILVPVVRVPHADQRPPGKLWHLSPRLNRLLFHLPRSSQGSWSVSRCFA